MQTDIFRLLLSALQTAPAPELSPKKTSFEYTNSMIEYEFQKPGSPSPPKGIIDRVQKLAALLHHSPKPEAFRVPHCLGYFDNAKRPGDSDADSEGDEDGVDPRIGFVFEKPKDEGVAPDTAPVSLFELLSGPKPRVTDRVRLAYAISNCVLYLHSVNWLHKGLRSHNIVFFPITTNGEGGKSSRIDYSKPYLSGFDFARPARADELVRHSFLYTCTLPGERALTLDFQTEVPGDVPEYNMYRHPSTQGIGFGPRESFRKSFDIYSLGVVLVELAHWSTIDKILNIQVGKVRMAAKIKYILLEDQRVADLGANMGEIYENATRKCISGGKDLGLEEADDETSDVVAAKLGMTFYEDVVKRLGDVRV